SAVRPRASSSSRDASSPASEVTVAPWNSSFTRRSKPTRSPSLPFHPLPRPSATPSTAPKPVPFLADSPGCRRSPWSSGKSGFKLDLLSRLHQREHEQAEHPRRLHGQEEEPDQRPGTESRQEVDQEQGHGEAYGGHQRRAPQARDPQQIRDRRQCEDDGVIPRGG